MKRNERLPTPSVAAALLETEDLSPASFIHPSNHPLIYLLIHLSSHLSFHPPSYPSLLSLIHSSIHPFIPEIFIVWNMCQLGFSLISHEVGPHSRPLTYGTFFCFSGVSQDGPLGCRKKISELLFLFTSYPFKNFQFQCMFYNEHNVQIPYYVYSLKLHAQKIAIKKHAESKGFGDHCYEEQSEKMTEQFRIDRYQCLE